MNKLSVPSKEIAIKILTEVSFEDRLIGYKLSERRGASSVTMYSFQEVVNFLGEQMQSVDFSALENWIREVMGDRELAEIIAMAVENENSNHARLLRIKDLMQERMVQCKKMV